MHRHGSADRRNWRLGFGSSGQQEHAEEHDGHPASARERSQVHSPVRRRQGGLSAARQRRVSGRDNIILQCVNFRHAILVTVWPTTQKRSKGRVPAPQGAARKYMM